MGVEEKPVKAKFEIGSLVDKEQAQAIAVEKIGTAYSGEQMRILSDLTGGETVMLSYLISLNSIIRCQVWDEFITGYLQLKVSKGRKGRTEILTASKSIEEEKIKKGAWERVKSLFGGGSG